jgi:hypothetical protein
MERQCPFFGQLHSRRPHQVFGKLGGRVSNASQFAFAPLPPCTKKMLWTCVLDHTDVVSAVRPWLLLAIRDISLRAGRQMSASRHRR